MFLWTWKKLIFLNLELKGSKRIAVVLYEEVTSDGEVY